MLWLGETCIYNFKGASMKEAMADSDILIMEFNDWTENI